MENRTIHNDALLRATIDRVQPPSGKLAEEARAKIDSKTKPIGSLGLLEKIACKVSVIQETLDPKIEKKVVLVFAADHGITQEGVSAYPSDVTPQMVMNFLNGGAAINVFCRSDDIDLDVVDVGVNYDFPDDLQLVRKKVAYGTRNFAAEEAMSTTQAIASLRAGIEAFQEAWRKKGPYDILGLGEMGIGNTTAASAVIAACTHAPLSELVGRGTGVDDEGLEHKRAVIRKALEKHRPNDTDGLEVLRSVGGFEIGAIAGAALAAAAEGVVVVLDGIISVAGGLLAYLLAPAVREYFLAGHASVEVGQRAALQKMNLDPILDLGFRLGEGTGAALAMHMVQAGCNVMREMASFAEAGVSEKS